MANINLPRVIFGTSGLGNLYTALDANIKKDIIDQCIKQSDKPAVFDSAGKYGAGLALETLGKYLEELNVNPDDVLISNKLGWLRTELKTPEPTFEPGVWKDLQHDAVQKISYQGILECYEQGNQLLNGYPAALVSVHDPDEYLNASTDGDDRDKRYQDILDAYRALQELKSAGKVKAIGIGAKDWKIIQKITNDIALDWVMIANSMTIHSHPADLLAFMSDLQAKGISIINSAVFNAGFLTGGNFYNYKEVGTISAQDKTLLEWREKFNAICKAHNIVPAVACVNFGLNMPGVTSIALNTTNPARVKNNVGMAQAIIPPGYWEALVHEGLIQANCLDHLKTNKYLI
jgi:D-threo-aldose 1-dehydrogenase